MKYIKFFDEIRSSDILLVGGKNASLGQMISGLSGKGIMVPQGFAVTSQAYWYFIEHNKLYDKIKSALSELSDLGQARDSWSFVDSTDKKEYEVLKKVAKNIREMIEAGQMPGDLEQEIVDAYKKLCEICECDKLNSFAVAVRSSATAEDLPGASFAGQQETFLNVAGQQELIECCKKSMASLFTERAIVYRTEKGFDHLKVALSVGVQKMVRSDLASAGVVFTIDTETGFSDVLTINSSYGLGEIVVKGEIIPDEFLVYKPTLKDGFKPIINKRLGEKSEKIVYSKFVGLGDKSLISRLYAYIESFFGNRNKYAGGFTKKVRTSLAERSTFTLTQEEILQLSKYSVEIENYYSQLNGRPTPMDIEWAKDGIDQKLYIVQARPETVHGAKSDSKIGEGLEKEVAQNEQKNKGRVATVKFYRLGKENVDNNLSKNSHEDWLESDSTGKINYGHKSGENNSENQEKKVLLTGQSIGRKIASGKVKVVFSPSDIWRVEDGDILVTHMTDPDWLPAMRKAAAIITDRGGRTCHAAIVSRELGICAIVGTENGTALLSNGQQITVDCSQGQVGYVYEGILDYHAQEVSLSLENLPCKIMFNIANPETAFSNSFLPNDGVGLARIEFIINNIVKIHPMAIIEPEAIKDWETSNKIDWITRGYSDKRAFFIDNLAYGIGTIAAAFYPKPVIVRFSDFKTNEYRNLIGGKYFEPQEENPMIGWRGASRYYDKNYSQAFALECEAIKKCREQMGLKNIKVMVPFVRTVKEAELVFQELEKNGLKRGDKNVYSSSGFGPGKLAGEFVGSDSGIDNFGIVNPMVGDFGVGNAQFDDNLEIIMMCEIPSNVILINEFAKIFDGFSIGSNDLTQLTLGVDRDSGILSKLFDESDPAVKKMMGFAIEGALKSGKHIGICGQAPSDLPEVAKFLIESGISSISLNPDSLGQFLSKFGNK